MSATASKTPDAAPTSIFECTDEFSLPFKTSEFLELMKRTSAACEAKAVTKTSKGGVQVGNLGFEALKDVGMGKIGYVNLIHPNGQQAPLLVQTDWMHCPWGGPREPAEEYRRPDMKKYSMELDFRGHEVSESIAQSMEAFQLFDDAVIYAGTRGQYKIKKNSSTNEDVLKTLYNPLVKMATDKNGEPTDKYPPSMKFKVPFYMDGKNAGWQCHATDVSEPTKTFADLANVVPQRSHVRAILQCVGVWANSSGSFGCSWKVINFHFRPQQIRTFKDYTFRDDGQQEKQLSQMIDLEKDEDEEDDEDDEEVVDDDEVDSD
jgi:hypothetical protein